MAREYELMVMLTPDVEEEQIPEKLSGLRELVTEHGGDIDVSSRDGEGTTFSVTLPLADSLAISGQN